MRTIMFVLIILAVPNLAQAATLKVPSQYRTIQDAIDAASGGDTVLVSPGTYVENINFIGKAITVRSEQGAVLTIIDGNQADSVVTFESGEGLNSILEGFKVTNGLGLGTKPNYTGGGITCINSSSPTIKHNNISGNSAHLGGGICCVFDSSPTITNNIISGNSAFLVYGDGGGICCHLSSPTITNNIITGNTADDDGGGIRCFDSTSTIANNIIVGNTAYLSYDGNGGGICCQYSSSTITNNTIMGNTSYHNGGGISGSYDSQLTISNNILWKNSAVTGPEMYVGNTSEPSIVRLSYSDVWGGQSSVHIDPGCTLHWGPGMIDAFPLFVDAAIGDFHLRYQSPCKDSGDNSAVLDPYDFEDDPRIAYGTVDMGADEFHTHLYYTGNVTPGGYVKAKFVGLPGTAPVGICLGSGVLDPPIPCMWGDWYLEFPIMGPILLGSIPSPDGVLIIPSYIPSSMPSPCSIPMQALIGAELTNLSVLEVK